MRTTHEFVIASWVCSFFDLVAWFFFFLYVTTVVGNLLLVVVFAFEHSLQKPMCIIMVSLALSDIGKYCFDTCKIKHIMKAPKNHHMAIIFNLKHLNCSSGGRASHPLIRKSVVQFPALPVHMLKCSVFGKDTQSINQSQSIFICIVPNHNKVISRHFTHRAGSKPNSSCFNFKETQHSHMSKHLATVARKNSLLTGRNLRQNQTQSGKTSASTGWG